METQMIFFFCQKFGRQWLFLTTHVRCNRCVFSFCLCCLARVVLCWTQVAQSVPWRGGLLGWQDYISHFWVSRSISNSIRSKVWNVRLCVWWGGVVVDWAAHVLKKRNERHMAAGGITFHFLSLFHPFWFLEICVFKKKNVFFVYYSPLTSYWSFERHWNKMTNKTIICHLIINWRWRDADVQLRPTEYCVVKVSRSDPPWFHRSAFGATLRSLKFLWVTERCSSPEAWKGICCVGFILSFISPLLSLH